jgi:hypothetical protein
MLGLRCCVSGCDKAPWGETEVVHYSDIERGAKSGSLVVTVCEEHIKALAAPAATKPRPRSRKGV